MSRDPSTKKDQQDDLSNKDLKWLLKSDKHGKLLFQVVLATVQYNIISHGVSGNVLTKTTGSFYSRGRAYIIQSHVLHISDFTQWDVSSHTISEGFYMIVNLAVC